MSSNVPVTVPPLAAAPFDPASPASPASADSPGVSAPRQEDPTQSEEEGDFCRGEIRTLDETDGLGPLFPGRNRHKSRNSALAYSMLRGPLMKANAHLENPTVRESSDKATRVSEVRDTTWFVEEQAGFRGNLRSLTPPADGTSTPLHLRFSIPEIRLPSRPNVDAIVRRNRPEPTMSTPPRRGLFLPLAMLAVISILGYVAAVQSVSAFQSAWRHTDTRIFEEDARTQASFKAENGEIPGPFAPANLGLSFPASTTRP